MNIAPPPFTYSQACADPNLFGSWFSGPTWAAWRVVDKALFGEPLSCSELEVFRQLTGRERAPREVASEAWLIVGRRGGKDVKAASLAVYLATIGVDTYGWRNALTRGERGVVQVLAVDRDQARVCFDYCTAFLQPPMLAKLVKKRTSDTIELTNGFAIEITTNDQRRVRGRTVVAAVFDEVAHWRSEQTANPDREVYRAVKPAMATIPNSLLIGISSPYGRRGLLWDKCAEHWGKSGPVLIVRAPTWVMNPTLSPDIGLIAQAYHDDAVWAAAEFGGEFRSDVEGYVSVEALDACIDANVRERPPQADLSYFAFVDPSGGSNDAMTLCIVHIVGKQVVVDALREVPAPFPPGKVVEEFAALLLTYQVWTIYGDRYAGEWPVEQFRQRGITYEAAEFSKSELYQAFLPMINSGLVMLPDHRRLKQQLLSLERRTTRGGRDSIDHPPGGHDDIANAVAGACVLAQHRGAIIPERFLQSVAISGDYDPLASPEENRLAAARAEAQAGYFSGPGWAPTWHQT